MALFFWGGYLALACPVLWRRSLPLPALISCNGAVVPPLFCCVRGMLATFRRLRLLPLAPTTSMPEVLLPSFCSLGRMFRLLRSWGCCPLPSISSLPVVLVALLGSLGMGRHAL